jgi:hypothetical protein
VRLDHLLSKELIYIPATFVWSTVGVRWPPAAAHVRRVVAHGWNVKNLCTLLGPEGTGPAPAPRGPGTGFALVAAPSPKPTLSVGGRVGVGA